MNFSKSVLSLFLCSMVSYSCAMQKNREKEELVTHTKEQLFRLARLAMQMSTKDQNKLTIYKKWSLKKTDENDADNGTPPLVIKTRLDARIDSSHNPHQYMPIVIHRETIFNRKAPHIQYSIVGIQNHAIRCYQNSRSWFENHPSQFATLVGLASGATGWFAKTWWNNRK